MFNFNQYTTLDSLKEAYRQLAKQHHPDLGGKLETMQALNEAYESRKRQLEGKASPFTGFWSRRTKTRQEPKKEAPKAKPQYRYVSCADTAKEVRQALKEAFPGVKFSVRSNTYSGGASIHVEWVDGPSTKEVDKVARQFEGSTFDGMVDLRSYHTSTHPKTGESVQWGADSVFTQRRYSRHAVETVLAELAKRYGMEMPPVKDGMGEAYVQFTNQWPYHMEEAYHRAISNASFYTPPKEAPKTSKGRVKAKAAPNTKQDKAHDAPKEEARTTSFKGHDILEIPLGDGEVLRLGKRKAKAVLEYMEAIKNFVQC